MQNEELHLDLNMILNLKPSLELNRKLNLEPSRKLSGCRNLKSNLGWYVKLNLDLNLRSNLTLILNVSETGTNFCVAHLPLKGMI